MKRNVQDKENLSAIPVATETHFEMYVSERATTQAYRVEVLPYKSANAVAILLVVVLQSSDVPKQYIY